MKILFVCTGNTCRSPMAEGIFRKMMREKKLENQVLCQSAGLSAAEGEPASELARKVCEEIGVELGSHRARRLTGEEIPAWDLFFTMSRTHGYILEQAGVPSRQIYFPPRTIEDPFGQDVEAYRRCREMLREELQRFADTWVVPFLPCGH